MSLYRKTAPTIAMLLCLIPAYLLQSQSAAVAIYLFVSGFDIARAFTQAEQRFNCAQNPCRRGQTQVFGLFNQHIWDKSHCICGILCPVVAGAAVIALF